MGTVLAADLLAALVPVAPARQYALRQGR